VVFLLPFAEKRTNKQQTALLKQSTYLKYYLPHLVAGSPRHMALSLSNRLSKKKNPPWD
jgi:hypothetical protein